jgi:acetolactate synthase-1/2/3 large subunit
LEKIGGDILLEALLAQDGKIVYGLPGDHILGIYDAFTRHKQIKPITVKHESAASFMADAHFRCTGEPGICIVTTGPGAANAVNGIAQAYTESSAVILICGQAPIKYWGKGSIHEIAHANNQAKIFEPITKKQLRIKNIAEIPWTIAEAYKTARSGRPGPVYIEIPMNVIEGKGNVRGYPQAKVEEVKPDPRILDQAADILIEAQLPIIYAGGGVNFSDASKQLIELAECLDAPVVTTVNGKGSIPYDHPLHAGLGIGRAGDPEAISMIDKSDVMLAVGCRFDAIATWFWTLKAPKNLIHIDVDSNVIGRVYPTKVKIVSDAKLALSQLLRKIKRRAGIRKRKTRELIAKTKVEFRKQLKEQLKERKGYVNPVKFVYTLRDVLDRDAILTTDVGLNEFFMIDFPVYHPRSFLASAAYNSMGFGIPAAIAAKINHPEKTVICVTGDGGFAMAGAEIATAVQNHAKIIIVIFNDKKYRILELLQSMRFKERYVETDLYNPDFMKLAEAYDISYYKIQEDKQTKTVLGEALADNKLSLIDVVVDPTIVPPTLQRAIGRKYHNLKV